MKAIWNGKVIAESNEIINVENNAYFPPESVYREFLQASASHTVCPWKGEASYYTLVVDGKINADAAWYYPHPKPMAQRIAGYVAFWKGVQIVNE